MTVTSRLPAVRPETGRLAVPPGPVRPLTRTSVPLYSDTRAPSTGRPVTPSFTATRTEPAPVAIAASCATVNVVGRPVQISVAGSPIRLFQTIQISTWSASASL
ncbi:MAG: hypothetical protein IPM94_06475 [bacterium]|nr:hypothetical protein [bacterium]